MKNLKLGITFIVLGNLLYLANSFFGRCDVSDFESLSDGLMLGLAVITNIIGIVLLFIYMADESKSKRRRRKIF